MEMQAEGKRAAAVPSCRSGADKRAAADAVHERTAGAGESASVEPLSRGDLRFTGKGGVFGSSPLMSALSFGLYMSWVYLACFST